MKDVNIYIKIFGGKRLYNIKMGTIKWKWCADQRKEFKFHIPNYYYVLDEKIRPLYP